MASLCSVVFANCGMSCSSTVLSALEARTFTSAALAGPVAKTASAKTFAAMIAAFRIVSSMKFVVVRTRGFPSLSVNARDRQKFFRLEACAADQRAVDVVDVHEFAGI